MKTVILSTVLALSFMFTSCCKGDEPTPREATATETIKTAPAQASQGKQNEDIRENGNKPKRFEYLK